ncbi:hypothetical protein, partial [Chromobacterium amazonense]|uniref:hypothetical protein n=1 Tax=Chromobacterium amazonense TaxID=1382803 RepID=UPI003F78B2E5
MRLVLSIILLLLTACSSESGTSRSFTIGGTLTGLAIGQQVVLRNNGSDTLTITTNGAFQFATLIAYGGQYSVTVAQSPAGQTCSIANESGEGAGIQSTVMSVQVVCSNQAYQIAGRLSGLRTGQQVILENNGSDTLTINANGTFKFPTPIARGGSYEVTVAQSPAGQTCSSANQSAAGVAIQNDVDTVQIVCSNQAFLIGGILSGLTAGQNVTVQNNGGDALTLYRNGRFEFATSVALGGSYAVAVVQSPPGQTCSIVNESDEGVDIQGPVSTVQILCSNQSFPISGTLSGLA